MAQSLTHKIIREHLIEGEMIPGREIGIKMDQTLTQDSTGTMVYLEFNAMGIPAVKTELSVSYIDHNTLQTGFENADDHRFLQSAAKKYGIHFSRAGNGICHQVHLERFSVPGKTLIGSDSHTPTCGGMGMFAIGAGGLDVASAMAGYPYYFEMPEIVNVRLHNKPAPWVSGKDIILELLRRLTVKGGVGKVIEYTGDGILYLDVPQRATITNMGAELGATSSIFPSDEVAKRYLIAQGRESEYIRLGPDTEAVYDHEIDIYLDRLEPMVALPHMPDRVVRVSEKEGLRIDQVFIGSCTNSSYSDLMRVARILEGKTVHPSVSLVIAPGSRQVMYNLASNGALADLMSAGARILECACGPCVGIGQAPPTGGISLRTSNRNFEGRSGTADAKVYLVSAETAAVSALYGRLTDPRRMECPITIKIPDRFEVNDNMIIIPECPRETELIMGPNIKPLPEFEPMKDQIMGEVLIKVGDNITTDHILPAGAKILPLRSNIPAISEYTFEIIDSTFPKRSKETGGGIIVGGENYGQGSSREHAALAPKYLGIKAVIAKSYARIHRQNLINFGIIPLVFADKDEYRNIEQGDNLEINNILSLFREDELVVENITKVEKYHVKHNLSGRQMDILFEGGLLQYVKNKL
ncbi:MAG: aconitate hydratase [Clostridia bacterium]|jgi:aconitate hydratase